MGKKNNNLSSYKTFIDSSDKDMISKEFMEYDKQFMAEYRADKRVGIIYFIIITILLISVFILNYSRHNI